jgi:hypothetical protein
MATARATYQRELRLAFDSDEQRRSRGLRPSRRHPALIASMQTLAAAEAAYVEQRDHVRELADPTAR